LFSVGANGAGAVAPEETTSIPTALKATKIRDRISSLAKVGPHPILSFRDPTTGASAKARALVL
jgi:hypothetical protein